MRLATLHNGRRDGQLIVVRKDGEAFVPATRIAPTLQVALDNWAQVEPELRDLAARLDANTLVPAVLHVEMLLAPLPRAYEWLDGSAFLNHVRLVRKARGAEPPATLETDPLVYQGGSGILLGAREPWVLPDEKWGLDWEAEVVAILGDVPQATTAAEAESHIKLLALANDWTYRNLVPDELAKSFGFFQSKPATAFSSFAITPDELDQAWRGGRVHLPLCSTYNGALAGDPSAGAEMHFSFHDLLAHIAKTRGFTAGTILGSGTVSNADRARGVSCLAEKRMIEIIETGKPSTPFMRAGDTIEIEMRDRAGTDLFGKISAEVVKP